MRTGILSVVTSLGLALCLHSPTGLTQSDHDFVFTDEDGHLLIRFAGSRITGLQASHIDEISNQEFSRMVHDRLRADLLFEVEPRDADWAAAMRPQIVQHIKHAGPEFSNIFVECRVASCRILLEQATRRELPAHRIVLDTVQASLEAFIASNREHFEPGFMITAYDQQYQTPHIKAFLRRARHGEQTHQPASGLSTAPEDSIQSTPGS